MNSNLHNAKRNKNDEFYTLYEDVEKELINYSEQFENKIVYCNCDTVDSNFYKYLKTNFKDLKLKKLYISSLDGELIEYDGVNMIMKKINGDFRSKDSIDILKQSDMIITNPPFSLFREYVVQLIEYEKEFLIMGNFNAVTYKEIFPLIKDNKMWLGYNSPKEFVQPDGSIKKFGNISWFTNLEVKRRKEPMKLYHSYEGNEDKYPKYDNYDAIEVSRVNSIPKDYEGVMGVPITFMHKHNPDQFKVLGIANSARWIGHECITIIEDRKVYNRILIRNKNPEIKEEDL